MTPNAPSVRPRTVSQLHAAAIRGDAHALLQQAQESDVRGLREHVLNDCSVCDALRETRLPAWERDLLTWTGAEELPRQVPKYVDLVETGLLWLVNTSVFHPRGFALGYDATVRQFTLLGDGTEAWVFEDDTAVSRMRDVQELFEGAGRSRSGMAARITELGHELRHQQDLVAELRRYNEALVRQVDRLRATS
jgi:hypothetical protein